MKVSVTKRDYVTFLLTELVALLQGKYKFEYYGVVYENKYYYEVRKPTFYVQTYTPEEASKHNTAYDAYVGYVKVTRKLI